jgi:hypothetical protein
MKLKANNAYLRDRASLMILLCFLFALPGFAQSKYGLTCYGTSCSAVDQKAEERLVNARTICTSGETEISYPRKDVPPQSLMQVYWANIHAAELIAETDFQVQGDCSRADLILRITLDTVMEQVSLTVTDADSGDAVFQVNRSVQDSRNDLIRAAKHFRSAVAAAKESEQARARWAQQRRQAEEETRQAEAYKQTHQCESDLTNLRQRIVLRSAEPSVLQSLASDIQAHNSKCPQDSVDEALTRKIQTESSAAQEKAVKERTLQEGNAERLKKVKEEAFAAWTQRIVSEPFVPPVDSWVQLTALPSKFYLILPGSGFTSNCHVSMERQKSVLDCLGEPGHNYYVTTRNHGRIYLLKSKQLGNGEYAGTVKDGGTSLCLRTAGCYRVLAEVREVPTQLPSRLETVKPGALSAHYDGSDFSFNYPQNWKVEERKAKDNSVAFVTVAPDEARLGSWVTHGFFVGHINKYAGCPQTLDGAFDCFATVQRDRGLAINSDAKLLQVGQAQSRSAAYTSPSIFVPGETGWLFVVKDKAEGYYWMTMFAPTGENLGQTFNEVLKTIKFTNPSP